MQYVTPSTPKTVHLRHSQRASPLGKKRRRLNNTTCFIPYVPPVPPAFPITPFRFAHESSTIVEDNDMLPIPPFYSTLESSSVLEGIDETCSGVTAVSKIVTSADRAAHSKKMLQADSHAKRKEYITREQEDKGTKTSYGRHIKAYQAWWESTHQPSVIAKDPSRDALPAFPITAAKAIMFLDYEASRPKRKTGAHSDTIEGTNVGRWSLKQAISALEWWRFNHQSDYEGDTEAHTSLRNDDRIRAFERAASHNEPKRIQTSQTLKAAGTSADTYTKQQLIDCSLWCLRDVSGPHLVFVGARDRAMLLLSTTIAFRGDSSRNLLWSDLFSASIPMDDISLGAELTALSVLSDNAKHNQNGRIDEHGALRHRHVELCSVSAIAILFFCYFHVIKTPIPNFTPNFSSPGYGLYGEREWYKLVVFSTKTPFDEMSYDNHRDRIKAIHEKNSVHITKATHGGRPYSVKTAREHGASVDGAKALGGWSESDSFKPCYDRTLPIDALLGAAMFNGRKPESYFLARGCLEPPAELLNTIFPWIGEEIAALEERRAANKYAEDIALWQFLHLLLWFRTVLVQDAAVLYSKCPNYAIFQFAPFNTKVFHAFAANSSSRIERVEKEAQCAFHNLPEQMANSLRGILSGLALQQQQDRAANVVYREEMQRQVVHTQELIAVNQKGRNKRKRNSIVIPPSTVSDVPSILSPAPLPPSVMEIDTDALFRDPVPHATTPFLTLPLSPPRHPSPLLLPFLSPRPSSLSVATATEIVTEVTQQPLDYSALFSSPDLVYRAVSQPTASLSSSVSSAAPPPTASIKATHIMGKEVLAWRVLAARHGDERLRKHTWTWIPETECWLPFYEYKHAVKITDIWVEYADGLDGHLSVRELNEGWGAKWKGNVKALKSEATRRNKIVDLVQRLAKKPNWSIQLALRFLGERYKHLTPRAFADRLAWNKNEGFMDILKASESYP